MKDLTIKELYDIFNRLIVQGHGDKEFRLLYDSETVYTSIPKGSEIRVNDDAVMFTDYRN